ncbi:group 1 glycosyl transferase [Arthrobacter sp. Leaf234]|uniref:glycosyltransferase n=1 Tax=Arthrobacter sp. Leaf234 TaxID=1736303 RepID=UPI0007006184|nr:glycosyltransferase [Arthrobacter sp. Leaf234]KQO01826.1 group 1 glycosyl transferase [Arthrobacter sp. Leaf234]
MRILVYPHSMSLGGSQLNALELAAAVQDLGHEVVVFAQDGPLVCRCASLGLEVLPAPEPRRRPSPAVVNALLHRIDRVGMDVLHGYEWPPALECVLASRLRPATPAVATVLSMAVAPFIPRQVPLLVGTRQIAAAETAFGRSTVGLMEPPVDLALNRPGLQVGQDAFRARWSIQPSVPTVVLVTRLAQELKLEGILNAMDTAAALSAMVPLQLVIVGDGPAEEEVARHAGLINRSTGRRTVILTGALDDPRPAYAVADIALGMGGSALRAMAFGAPLIVQGEKGYWKLLSEDSLPEFLWQGWYGVGSAPGRGHDLGAILGPLLIDPSLRTRLGTFALSTVQEHFSLTQAARTQIRFYEEALARPAGQTGYDDAAAGARFLHHTAARYARRMVGRAADEDFNAHPVAGREDAAPSPVAG